MLKNIITTCCFLLILSTAFAQNIQLINGDFRGLNFTKFADTIEASYPYHFYFDQSETDSIKVDVVANNFSVQQLLDTVLKGSSFHFAVDSLNRIFITNKLVVQTNFPSNYFSPVQH